MNSDNSQPIKIVIFLVFITGYSLFLKLTVIPWMDEVLRLLKVIAAK
jgi:hypothetical protein